MSVACPAVTAGPTLCAHCNLPVPAGLLSAPGELQFCCAGCRAVFETIQSCGLGTYYKLRDSAQLPTADPGATKFEVFDSAAFEALHVGSGEDGTRSTDLFLEGVTCGACVWLVERLPAVLPGVVEARLSLTRSTVRVTWHPGRVRLSDIAQALDGFGYRAHPARGASRESQYRREVRSRLIRLGVAGALMGNLMLLAAALYAGWAGAMDGGVATMLRWLSLGLGMTALAWPGGEFFRSTWGAIRARTINLDVPITVALAAGGVAGTVNVVMGRGEIYFDSVSALIFLLLVGRFVQFRHQRKSRDAVELLFSMTPATCRVLGPEGEARETPIAALAVGDNVEVRPGDLMPADGVVIDGASTVDQALLTGESVPVAVGVGAEVFGSSRNGPSRLVVRVSCVGEATRVGRLMRLLDQGLGEKPEIVRFADRVGRWFVVAVGLVAIITFAWWARTSMPAAIDHTVALLIVTCPCVLGLATPMTISVAIGLLARRDVLVKSGGALERLARGGRMMLDKTGTLTEGALRVVDFSGDEDCRGVVARLERSSNHPIARALVSAFESYEPPANLRGALQDITEHLDGGISGSVNGHAIRIGSASHMRRYNIAGEYDAGSHADDSGRTDSAARTTVLVAVDGVIRARVTLEDSIREGTREAVDALRALGYSPEIWSGDSAVVVTSVAKALGITHAHGEASPEDKLAAVRGKPDCLMIGDGVNDSAALAAAGVGVAVHGGSEASLAAADVYIARPGLSPVVNLVKTARRTMAIIRVNFAISLAYNLLAGLLAVTGHMNPLIAAVLMPLSSVTVLFVAVSLLKLHAREAR